VIGNGAGGAIASGLRDAGEAATSSVKPHTPSPVEQAAGHSGFEKFTPRWSVHTHLESSSDTRWFLVDCFQQEHLLRLVLLLHPIQMYQGDLSEAYSSQFYGSHVSRDFSVSSQVTSRPVYAAVRAIMQDRADSAPLSA